ncbi:DinB family protein [Magnetospirillum moscoviense]|uniref:Damage-inducible protein DinB n=1 Tax=Magnetospirillum moscoviense TaxID=1437059 RepID=A0A178N097_9PROT|nr:DinB family protein [Magnetospirillum moscoviense]OAN59539.1 hypothetical protein A6A05_07305 [Magnetospirillum moscoviense]
MDHGTLQRLARYNQWANGRLYAACGQLGQDELARERPSYFGSILATLNHILLADRVWMGRFEGQPAQGIVSLGQILHPDFSGLKEARDEFDRHIVAWCDGLSGDLARPLAYRTIAGVAAETPLNWSLFHFFNHQTHHRGQVHGLLSHAGIEPPPLDLIYHLREA